MAWTKRTGIMLCQPLDDKNLERNFKSFPLMLAQPKLDGVRAWVDWVDDMPILISSEGNVYESAPHIQLALKDLAKMIGQKVSFDGELYIHNRAFEDVVGMAKRKSENKRDDYLDLQYHIFDYKGFNVMQGQRIIDLKEWFTTWVHQADQAIVNALNLVPTFKVTKEEVSDKLTEFVEQGYEGIILRNPSAFYTEKRPWTILKWKPSKHDWYEIVEVIEAKSEKGVPLGRAGAVTCIDRFGNVFNVGTGLGLTHEKAEELWQNRETLKGMFAEVYYQNLTTNGVPRFGKFSLVVEASAVSGENH